MNKTKNMQIILLLFTVCKLNMQINYNDVQSTCTLCIVCIFVCVHVHRGSGNELASFNVDTTVMI